MLNRLGAARAYFLSILETLNYSILVDMNARLVFCLFFFSKAAQPPSKNGSVEQLFMFEGHNERKSHFGFGPPGLLVGQGFTVTSESKAVSYKVNELTGASL